jgi:hypothetical protein
MKKRPKILIALSLVILTNSLLFAQNEKLNKMRLNFRLNGLDTIVTTTLRTIINDTIFVDSTNGKEEIYKVIGNKWYYKRLNGNFDVLFNDTLIGKIIPFYPIKHSDSFGKFEILDSLKIDNYFCDKGIKTYRFNYYNTSINSYYLTKHFSPHIGFIAAYTPNAYGQVVFIHNIEVINEKNEVKEKFTLDRYFAENFPTECRD